MNEWMNLFKKEWMNEWIYLKNEWMNEFIKKNEWMNEFIKIRMYEYMKKWMNEFIIN